MIMVQRIPKYTKGLLDKAQDSATQAVATYNDPRSSFRTGNFVVLMCIAWTSMLHAYFEKKKIKYYYKQENGRYVKVDGENKAWDLSKCVDEVFDANDPVRVNLELFVKLRHKIEHRNLPALDQELVGECQALVLNFEHWLVTNFGHNFSLMDTMFVPIQLTNKARVLPKSKLEENVVNFVKDYRNYIDSSVVNSQEYAFKAFLVPKIGNHRSSSDIAIEFVRYDSSNPEEMEKYDRAIVAIKEKHVPVVNQNVFKPSEVISRLNKLGHDVNSHWHVEMWKKYKVRPPSKAKNKADCKTDYCTYDRAHSDYLYTDAWVQLLLEKELKRIKTPSS